MKASLALLLGLAGLLAPAPAGAHVIVEPFFRTPTTVGQTGLRGELRLINEDEAGPSYSICNPGECNSQGITLTPSCATHGGGGQCVVAEPDVFSISPTGVGVADTACAGMMFSITSLGAGRYSFSPAVAGQHVVLPPLFRCRIEFTFDVLQTPANDARPDLPGLQTSQVAEVFSVASGSPPASDLGFSSVTFADSPSPRRPPVTPSAPLRPVPAPDTIDPLLSALSVSPARFRAARRGPSNPPRAGARVRYTLSEPARFTARVERAASGRRAGRRCVSPRRAKRGARRCVRYITLRGSIAHAGRAGSNTFRFSGRLRGRSLRPGRYRLRGVATDAAGNSSRPRRTRFRISR